RRRHTRSKRDWSSDVCSSDLQQFVVAQVGGTDWFAVGAQIAFGQVRDPGTQVLQGSRTIFFVDDDGGTRSQYAGCHVVGKFSTVGLDERHLQVADQLANLGTWLDARQHEPVAGLARPGSAVG